jgi:hypothetical protein
MPRSPSKSLSPALLKVKPRREQFQQFKTKLFELVEQIKRSPTESEEHHKNHISDFLKYAFRFPAYLINTSDKIDLVIHNGKLPTDSVGVIIETKRPANQAEMPTRDNLNVKAMQEPPKKSPSWKVMLSKVQRMLKHWIPQATNWLTQSLEPVPHKFAEYLPYWA